MAKIISFFNHKGGVGKTTNAFHIAWQMAEDGNKVLLVDADPQCNLTGLTLGIDDYDSLFKLYSSNTSNNIYSCLEPFFNGKVSEIFPSDITNTKNANLFILPGHVDIAKFDDEISTAIKVARPDNMQRMLPLIGMFNNLVRRTATKHNIDIVLIDMSPSISATNMCLLMGSDYFIVPTAPDFFSHQAIDSLSKVLPKWPEAVKSFKDDLLLPRNNPKMIGTLLQNYRRYDTDGKKAMATTFSQWADRIRDTTNTKLITALKNADMVISEDIFNANVQHDKAYNLGQIQNFNTLIPKSQHYSMPIYALTEKELNWTGDILENALKNVEEARKRYAQITKSILKIIN